jgi:ligand-binding sensor domain-containing protein/DNA-binding CsgD family transcriptional regulator
MLEARFLSVLVAVVVPMVHEPLAAAGLEFKPVGENRGLDVAMPVDILVDRRGYLWVGSRAGLYRYDGYQAVSFKSDANDPGTISDLDIRALYEDSDGILWVATNTSGLNRFDPVTSRFTRFLHDPADPETITHDSTYHMAEGPAGDLWVGSQIGLSRIDRDTGKVRRYFHDPDDDGSLANDYVFSVFRDRQGVLWVATIGGGLNRYNTATDSFTRFDLAAATNGSVARNDVFRIAEDDAERLWIGTREGLVRFDRDRVTLEAIDLGLRGDIQPTITAARVDDDDQLWLGTLNRGVIRIDAGTNETVVYADYSAKEIGGLASQPVLSLTKHGDLLFIGTWGAGLWSARVSDTAFQLFGAEDAGLRNDLVMAVLPGREPGQPLIGSFGGGPQAFDVEAGSATELPSLDAALTTSGALGFEKLEDGTVYMGTSEGLYRIDSEGRLQTAWEYDAGDPASIGDGYVTSVVAAGDGTIWVGVGGSGLHRLDPETGRFIRFRNDPGDANTLSGNYITDVLAESGDRLWVGTRSSGLNDCVLPDMRCRRFSGDTAAGLNLGHINISAIYRDSRGRVWVGSADAGLYEVLRGDGGEVTGFRHWTEDDGLLSNSIMAVEEDLDASLWLSSRHGLTRFDPDQGRIVNYVEAGGLPVSHFNNNASAHDDDYIYFGSVAGLMVVPRGRPFESREPLPVRITGIDIIGAEASRPGSGWVPETVEADYGDMLAIGFAVLDFAEVPHEYQFRIDEDDAWSPLGNRNEVTLLKLSPGEYRFTARGRDVFGAWAESPPVTLEIVPPFWMAAWFRTLVVVLLAALAFGAHRLRTDRLRLRALEIERLGARREAALEKALSGKSELAVLTPRQKEVLQLIAEGYSTREIAERLDVSVKTVETHRAHLMDRLDIRDVPGLVRLAIRAGLISPHD